MSKRYRWVCPECEGYKLGPQRPKRRATLRFCLPCSKKKGELVERCCPTLDKKREARARQVLRRRQTRARRKEARRQTRKEQEEARWVYRANAGSEAPSSTFYDLRREATMLLKIARAEGYKVRRPRMTVNWRHQGSYTTGRSWGGRIHMTIPKDSPVAPAIAVLAHELAHEAVPRDEGHGADWRWVFKAMVEQGYEATMEFEPGCNKYEYHRAAVRAIAEAIGEKLTEAQLETEEEESS